MPSARVLILIVISPFLWFMVQMHVRKQKKACHEPHARACRSAEFSLSDLIYLATRCC